MAATRKPAEKPAASEPVGQRVDKAYVAVDALSWRPHPLVRGSEVQDVLPAGVLEACLADGRVTRENPLG